MSLQLFPKNSPVFGISASWLNTNIYLKHNDLVNKSFLSFLNDQQLYIYLTRCQRIFLTKCLTDVAVYCVIFGTAFSRHIETLHAFWPAEI